MDIQIGRELFMFDGFNHWCDTAQDKFKAANVTSNKVLCIDANGRICAWGTHFMQAAKDDAYPVRVYLLRDDTTETPNVEHNRRAIADLGVTVDEAKAGAERSKANQRDAERYRWLRAQHWSDSAVAVVTDPKQNVRLGAYCPGDILLDSAIDEAMKVGAYGTALKTPNGGV